MFNMFAVIALVVTIFVIGGLIIVFSKNKNDDKTN